MAENDQAKSLAQGAPDLNLCPHCGLEELFYHAYQLSRDGRTFTRFHICQNCATELSIVYEFKDVTNVVLAEPGEREYAIDFLEQPFTDWDSLSEQTVYTKARTATEADLMVLNARKGEMRIMGTHELKGGGDPSVSD
jgi:hypothetical protein